VAKDAYYFSHDSNARNDEKILMLRAEHGWQGYGLYWALLEMMFEATETCLSHAKIKGIAISYNVDITLLESVISTCKKEQLFVSNGTVFWSESLRERKQKFLDLKRQKSDAGRKGMANRWGTDNAVITENNKVKESKEKEIKGKETTTAAIVDKFSNNIHPITPIELDKLTAYLDDGFEPAVIVYAIERAVTQGKRNLAYIEGVLKRLRGQNLLTMADVEAAERDYQDRKIGKPDAPKEAVDWIFDESANVMRVVPKGAKP
jgi:DnaD/phage-associated family protein